MQITVKFFGIFHTLAGLKELRLDLQEGATLRQAFDEMGGKLAPEFSAQILAPLQNEPAATLRSLILLNQTRLEDAAELDRPLANGDLIAWVPPMEGGAGLNFNDPS